MCRRWPEVEVVPVLIKGILLVAGTMRAGSHVSANIWNREGPSGFQENLIRSRHVEAFEGYWNSSVSLIKLEIIKKDCSHSFQYFVDSLWCSRGHSTELGFNLEAQGSFSGVLASERTSDQRTSNQIRRVIIFVGCQFLQTSYNRPCRRKTEEATRRPTTCTFVPTSLHGFRLDWCHKIRILPRLPFLNMTLRSLFSRMEARALLDLRVPSSS